MIFLAIGIPFIVFASGTEAAISESKIPGFTRLGSYNYTVAVGGKSELHQSTYFLNEDRVWWDVALANCEKSGLGTLLSIESAEEDAAILRLLYYEGISAWISGNYEESNWKWASTGQVMNYTNWFSPPSSNEAHGVYIDLIFADEESYGWFTYTKSRDVAYICEQQTQLSPL